MTLQTDLETAVAKAKAAAELLHDVVNGPSAGDGSTVAVASGPVKTVARAIADAAGALAAAADSANVAASAADAAKFIWRGAWEPAAYEPNDVVAHLGASWIALEGTDEEPGPGSTAWDLVAKAGVDGLVAAIAAGVGIEVDPVDPAHPVVSAAIASQEEAEAGIENGKLMTPERSAQQIAAMAVRPDADAVLAAAYGQDYQPLGSLDAMPGDTLVVTAISGSNRKSLTVDVDGTLDVSAMASGGLLLACVNAGVHTPVIVGSTPTIVSCAWDSATGHVNYVAFESDDVSGRRRHAIFQ